MMLSKTKIRNWAFLAGFFSLLFYDFHRYIFKYNSEGTSPTYTNTPIIWKMGKYLLMMIIAAVFFSCLTYTKRVNKWFIFIYGVIIFILLVNLLNFVIYRELDIDEVEYCLWFFVIIPYWFAADSVFNIDINYRKIMTWSAIILFISNGIAVGNYYLTGRLPALGYDGGLVRFGGFWDDPNAFGIACVFYFYYFITSKKYLLSLIGLASIVLTFSFTAYFLLIASIGFWLFSNYKVINKKWGIIGTIIVSSIVLVGLYFYDLITSLYEIKSQSVTEHLSKNMIFNIIPLQNSSLQFSENWYESSFYNYFPVSILIHGAFLLLFISLFKTSDNKDLKFYFFLFVTSSFFFSMLYTFPLNLIFIFLLVDYLKRRTPLTTIQSLY
jgi:hypothetical protein